VRRAAAALVLALAVAGCVTRRVETAGPVAPAPAPTPVAPISADDEDPVEAMAALDLRIECDRVRVQVPERLRAEVQDRQKCDQPPFLVLVRKLSVITREDLPVVEVGGDDFSVVAEGGVRTTRTEGGASVVEGPFEAVILKNGRLLRR
jgi:hypothetical protein